MSREWFEKVLNQIRQSAEQSGTLRVAIDGRCGSGKTTLAHKLQSELGCAVVSMDDFFLRLEQRTKERYETPGGNVDYERFREEVADPLLRGERASYRPFDCRTFTLGKPVILPEHPILLVEGTYSSHPALWDFYHLHIFLSVSPEEQKKRILAREGEKKWKMFESKWIPLEELYFSACHAEERSELRIRTD
jgi:uridine kinase